MMKNVIKRLTENLKKLAENFVYYNLLVDLYLLAFFSKKYAYLFFVFAFFFGTFGYTDQLTETQFCLKFVCFVFSSYLVYISVIVFVLFNVPLTKDYLYKLLGKEFVTSKIGHPGIAHLAKFGGLAASIVAVNETGRAADAVINSYNADKALNSQLESIDKTQNLTLNDKREATKDAFKMHHEIATRKPEGTIDRVCKIETIKGVSEKVVDNVGGWFSWGKKK